MMFKVNQLIFPLPVVVFVAGMILIDSYYGLSTFLMVCGITLYLLIYLMIRCPACNKSPYLRRMKSKSSSWAYTLPLAEARCSECGFDFSARPDSKSQRPIQSEKAR